MYWVNLFWKGIFCTWNILIYLHFYILTYSPLCRIFAWGDPISSWFTMAIVFLFISSDNIACWFKAHYISKTNCFLFELFLRFGIHCFKPILGCKIHQSRYIQIYTSSILEPPWFMTFDYSIRHNIEKYKCSSYSKVIKIFVNIAQFPCKS